MTYLRNASLIGFFILGVLVYSPLTSYFSYGNFSKEEKETEEETQQESEQESKPEPEKIVNELTCAECGEPGRKRMNKDAKLVVSCRKCWAEVDETEEDVWSSVLRKNNS